MSAQQAVATSTRTLGISARSKVVLQWRAQVPAGAVPAGISLTRCKRETEETGERGRTGLCVAMQRVTAQLVAGLVAAALSLSLLADHCWADGGGPSLAERVIWAVNAGGESHVDVHGIHFKKDPLEGKIGKASDYGMRLPILRSSPEDQVLYQTERYNEDTFGYDVPIREEGDYILVMKYAEVYFAQSQQKVFDVRLNGHVVVKDLDIFERVGHSTAHDEIVSFSIRRGKLSVQGEVSTFNGKLTVEFVKGYYDNPKVCALYVMKGTLEDVPKLQPHPGLEKHEEEEEEEEDPDAGEEGGKKKVSASSKTRVQSGPRTPNPYAADNSSLMFPILVAFGVFIPTLFCLCRL